MENVQITQTLSVSFNKIGDLKYYDEDLKAARSYYFQALDVRRNAIKHPSSSPSQVSNPCFSYWILNTHNLFDVEVQGN